MNLIAHNIGKGVDRLIAAPRDLSQSVHWVEPHVHKVNAPLEHRNLYEEYLEYLEEAVYIAMEWWGDIVDLRMEQEMDLGEAIEQSYQTFLAGPASRPELIWVIRHFWIQCASANSRTDAENRVPPEVFLLAWLVDDNLSDYVSVISGMPYWPIGLDKEGNWV